MGDAGDEGMDCKASATQGWKGASWAFIGQGGLGGKGQSLGTGSACTKRELVGCQRPHMTPLMVSDCAQFFLPGAYY